MTEDRSFEEFQARLLQLMGWQAYREALELLEREGTRYEAHLPLVLLWRIAVLARQGATRKALGLCDEARAAGYWYAEEELRERADFATLQSEAAFEKLVVYSAERRRRAEQETQPTLTLFAPPQLATPAPLLIALHGEVSNAASAAAHWPRATARDEGWMVALPQSSQISWLSDHYAWDDMEQALAELAEHYTSLRQAYPIDPHRIVLAGFAQGGVVALEAALRQTVPARGVLLVEPAVHDLLAEGWPAPGDLPAGVGLRACLVAGATRGGHYEAANQLCARLKAEGAHCTVLSTTNTWHGFGPEFPAVLHHALSYLTS